ncbi:chemotaxis protein CheA [Geobacter sp. DSM 9736]|uniref:chemotaxis protein CheA n=1 Tax=Geobacter sp. DSM 9736 TaxID=1277350 RepID=UPI000B621D38|nr:chemotaxis protein CheA [Geobacter sp. DSM 9736]SNB44785.1 two-component system, chemotaxis family, sensor kinase CheA [Geobacter sp. DSM 9736]
MMENHRQAFKEEAYELLAELETSLLELEDSPQDMEIISRVFRAMHTIKGSGAMFGFDDIAAFTHQVETVFDTVRNGKLEVTKRLIDLTLAARDRIKLLLDSADEPGSVDEAAGEALITEFKALLPQAEQGTAAAKESPSSENPDREGDLPAVTYRVRFKPIPGIFRGGTNPVSLLNELRELGECTVIAQTAGIPPIKEMDPEECHLSWDIILSTSRGKDAILDVFIFVEDDCELAVEVIDDGGSDREGYKKLGEILIERGDITKVELESVLAGQRRIGELLVESGLVEPGKVQSALLEQQHVKEVRQERQSQESATSIRVPAERLDTLVNLVGELVTVQARLSQIASVQREPGLMAVAEEVERLTAELRDNALNIRMLPIGSTFSKFKRLVRDLSAELGKEIELTTEGAETELDKTVIEKLNDPLVHLIRNSIDHGIESPEVREAGGKPRQGTVHLAAVHSGDSVFITIKDDGAGLDKEAIRAKAVERGLIPATAELTDKEIFGQIFVPGFSTAKAVTSVSGRGVGMDVVKRSIEALRGSIELSSKRGEGTTITVKIPLTLAIIESLLVRIGEDRFVMPLAIVEECVELTREDVERAHGRHLANVRGQIVPYIPLRSKFAIRGDSPDIEQIVITEIEGRRVGFVVDDVIGEHQTVIKSLGRMYRDIDGLSGATILGDGTVALILDIPKLVQLEERSVRAA